MKKERGSLGCSFVELHCNDGRREREADEGREEEDCFDEEEEVATGLTREWRQARVFFVSNELNLQVSLNRRRIRENREGVVEMEGNR